MLYIEEEPLVLRKQPRLPPKGYPNARDSIILVQEENGMLVYKTSGIYVSNGFVINKLQQQTKTCTAQEQHKENWCDHALRESNERQARDVARHNDVYGCYTSANALTAILTNNPQETKAWLKKVLKGYYN
jgi:hypothetical protein